MAELNDVSTLVVANKLPSNRFSGLSTGRWKPGESGNPAGRPALAESFREKCKRWAEEGTGWRKLQQIAERDGDREQLRAIELILAYAYGRPPQSLTLDVAPIRFEVVQRLMSAPVEEVEALAAGYRLALASGEIVEAEVKQNTAGSTS